MVYAALQENRLKLGISHNPTYRHCAQLLLQLEQCVVYGGGGALATTAAFGTSELMQECVRVASQSQSGTSLAPGEDVVLSGMLRKQGGATSRFGRKTWHERYCEVRASSASAACASLVTTPWCHVAGAGLPLALPPSGRGAEDRPHHVRLLRTLLRAKPDGLCQRGRCLRPRLCHHHAQHGRPLVTSKQISKQVGKYAGR